MINIDIQISISDQLVGRLTRSFPTRVFTFGSGRAIFADHVEVHPHFEDDPRNGDESAIFKISVLVFVRGVIRHHVETGGV